jgi:hypothetical protein
VPWLDTKILVVNLNFFLIFLKKTVCHHCKERNLKQNTDGKKVAWMQDVINLNSEYGVSELVNAVCLVIAENRRILIIVLLFSKAQVKYYVKSIGPHFTLDFIYKSPHSLIMTITFLLLFI